MLSPHSQRLHDDHDDDDGDNNNSSNNNNNNNNKKKKKSRADVGETIRQSRFRFHVDKINPGKDYRHGRTSSPARRSILSASIGTFVRKNKERILEKRTHSPAGVRRAIFECWHNCPKKHAEHNHRYLAS